MLRGFLQRLFRMTKVTEQLTASSPPRSEQLMHEVHDGRVEKHHPGTPATTESAAETPNGQKRVKTFRYAMLLGYQGKNYFGMQVQKGVAQETIEGHILKALLANKWITQAQFEKPFDFFFQRAARTDRAVSAVRQICSLQLPRMEDLSVDGAARMNDHLPEDIRVFGFRRATSQFHAQKNCDARTYAYTLPTFTFAKPTQRTDGAFRFSGDAVQELNAVLDIFKGTHNFFNYTSRRAFNDRSCFRYITEFEAGEPFLFHDELRNQDVEFITIRVKGQSFILHQIRKMIGMTIAVIRELANKSDIQRSFEGKRMDVPRAPGLGLVLERLHYHKYDKQFAKSHEPLSNWGEDIEKRVEELKNKFIVNEIMDTEIREQSMMKWLSDLQLHNFTVDAEEPEVPERGFVAEAAATAKAAQQEVTLPGDAAPVTDTQQEKKDEEMEREFDETTDLGQESGNLKQETSVVDDGLQAPSSERTISRNTEEKEELQEAKAV